jgi:PAS domain S-box-containing protein
MSEPRAPAPGGAVRWLVHVLRWLWLPRGEARRTVRGKLMAVVVQTASIALLLAAIAMAAQDLTAYRQARASQLTTEASILGLASAPALAFDDRAAAQRTLATLRAHSAVLGAALYGTDGSQFARYLPAGETPPPARLSDSSNRMRISGDQVTLSQRITQNGEWLGTIYLRAHFDMTGRILTYLGIIALVTIMGVIVALVLSTALHRAITAPLDAMASVARHVVQERDYQRRAELSTDDEIGVVVQAFNRMLDEMQSRTRELEQSNAALQSEVRVRKAAEAALARSERLYRAIGESIQYGVWVTDASGQSTYVSESYLALTGLKQEEVGASWEALLHPDDAVSVMESWGECIRNGGAWYCEYRIRGTDGLYHPILAQGVPISGEDGKVTGWAGINLDISRLKQTEEALREADRRKDEFLATLAHELRNPLAPIRNAAGLLELRAANDQQRQWASEVITRQVKRMGLLLDDLLDVSRITLRRLELRKESVSLASVIATAIETAQPLINAKQHSLEVSLPEEPVHLQADPLRLSQAISNLLNNAAKYTDPRGRIRLSAKLAGNELRISVSDNGIGFDPQAQPRLFQMFSQVKSAVDRTEGGLGIGLALVKGLVALHEGAVQASSEGPGRGSTFTIRLPGAYLVRGPQAAKGAAITAAAAPRAEKAAVPAATAGAGQSRVLIADDNHDSAESLAMLLDTWGYEVFVAHSGTEALEVALRERPDACILDIGMPGMSGYEVARELRAQGWGAQVLLVALTGWGQSEDVERARAAGFDAHMTKPVDLARVEALLREYRLTLAGRLPAEDRAVPPATSMS